MNTRKRLIFRMTTLMLSLFLVIFAVTADVTYTWFTNLFKFGTGSITTTTTPPFSMEIYHYISKEVATEEAGTEKEGYWNSQKDINGDEEELIEFKGSSDGNLFTLSALPFGNVDNLVDLNPDNYLYFVFKIDANKNGKNLKVNTSLVSDDEFDLYDKEEEITDSITGEKAGLKEAARNVITSSQMIQFEYLLSESYYYPGHTEESNDLSKMTFTKFDNNKDADGKYLFNSMGFDDNIETTNEYYYLYLKAYPVLESYSALASAITTIMPCILLWNFDFTISIH